jgi:RNA-directed DNA polymerase
VWIALWRWAKRRHHNKGKRWIANRYFKIRGKGWEFSCQVTDRRGKSKELTLFNIAGIPIERHVKVKGTASLDDPNLTEYWGQKTINTAKICGIKGQNIISPKKTREMPYLWGKSVKRRSNRNSPHSTNGKRWNT